MSADDRTELTDEAKASVINSGALANLKQVRFDGETPAQHAESLHELRQQVHAAIENIQQLLTAGNLKDTAYKKLELVLSRLIGALTKDTSSSATLTTVLSEATSAMSGDDGAATNATQQQAVQKLWQTVEADNKAINDDFEKMRDAGITFNDKLWNRHKELMEYLQMHPRDLKTQKELDAVDDAMLLQAEPQLKEHPDAKLHFDDATKKSKERHEVVDKALAAVADKKSLTNAAFDDDARSSESEQGRKLTMNDVTSQSVGQKSKPAGRQYT